jgi:hypothetical protein
MRMEKKLWAGVAAGKGGRVNLQRDEPEVQFKNAVSDLWQEPEESRDSSLDQ